MNHFFKESNSPKEKYLLKYPIGEFKNKLLKNDENNNQILLKKNLTNIMIFEKEKMEHILIYSNNKDKDSLKNVNVLLNDNEKYKSENFHIINNTIPKIKTNNENQNMIKNLKKISSNNSSGYQILSYKDFTLLGLFEGPPNTPYENGYFLFKILYSSYYPMKPPKFYFISSIFHPNISDNGFVSVDILYRNWSPALCYFEAIIYSVQSLLDDPNPDDFLNETAAKLYKNDRKLYDETVREYTSQFANYSKLFEDINKIGIKYEIIHQKKD